MGQESANRVPFFIVGCGRSGTTLLRSMLVAHPLIEVPGETHFVPNLLRARPVLERNGRLDRDRFVSLAVANRRLGLSGVEAADLRAALDERQAMTVAEAVEEIYWLYDRLQSGPDSQTTAVGDKTPTYVTALPLLADRLPGAKFVHVIRDGRSVAASIERMPWGPRSTEGALAHWERVVRSGRRAGAGLGDRYREVRYEDLVESPIQALMKVTDHLGVAFDPTMLGFADRAQAISEQNLNPSTHARIAEPLSLAAVPKMDTVAQGTSELLNDLGYESRGEPAMPFGQRLRSQVDDRLSTGPISVQRVRTVSNLVRRKLTSR